MCFKKLSFHNIYILLFHKFFRQLKSKKQMIKTEKVRGLKRDIFFENVYSKKAQITIFIIVALLIVASIVVVFILINRGIIFEKPEDAGVEQFIERCSRNALEDVVDGVIKNGGVASFEDKSVYEYNGKRYFKPVSFYLNMEPGATSYPLLTRLIAQDIEENLSVFIESCFNSLDDELRLKGFDVSEGSAPSVGVVILERAVMVNISRQMTIQKSDFVQSFDSFNARISSPLGEFITVARIVIDEALDTGNVPYCDDAIPSLITGISCNQQQLASSPRVRLFTLNRGRGVTIKEFKFVIEDGL